MRIVLTMTLVLLCAAPLCATDGEWSLKVGEEIDSNPERLVGEGSSADGGVRALLGVDLRTRLGRRASLSTGGRTGGRLTHRTKEVDAFAGEVNARLRFWLSEDVYTGVRGDTRHFRERRGTRDYTRWGSSVELGAYLWDGWVHAQVTGGYSGFAFTPNRDLGWLGPTASARFDVFVSDAWTLGARYAVASRPTEEGRWVVQDVGTLAYDPASFRRDTFHGSSALVSYAHHRVVADLSLSAQWNLSNSVGRGYTRRSVDASVTYVLFGNFLMRVAASLQRTRFDDPAQIDETFVLDDENRSYLSVTFEQPFPWRWMLVESRVVHYRGAFGSTDASRYRRTSGYLGLTFRGNFP